MKTNLKVITALLALIMLSLQVSAQKRNVLKANLLSPVVRTGSFFYERVVHEASSLQFGYFYTGASIDETTLRGYGVTLDFRYYLSERPAPSGFFVSPFGRYQNFNLTHNNDEGEYTSFGGGLLVGIQTLLRNAITLEAFVGPSYSVGEIEVSSGQIEDFDTGWFDGFGIRFGITIGLAF